MIVSSEIIDDCVVNGVRRIEERHVDELGRASYCSRTVSESTTDDEITSDMLARRAEIVAAYEQLDSTPAQIPDQPSVLLGEGAPTMLAEEGQFYLDTVSFNLYVFLGGTW